MVGCRIARQIGFEQRVTAGANPAERTVRPHQPLAVAIVRVFSSISGLIATPSFIQGRSAAGTARLWDLSTLAAFARSSSARLPEA